jgi:hypothetical protein
MSKYLLEKLIDFFSGFSDLMGTGWGVVIAGVLLALGFLLNDGNDGGALDCVTSFSGRYKDADC